MADQKNVRYFKYMKMDYLEDSILYGAYASILKNVNDPYEWEGIVRNDDFRICCLTNSSRKMLMWSYYTNHRGCCVEFAFDKKLEETGILRPVKYLEVFGEHRYMTEDEIIESLYCKGKEWDVESEQRAVWHKNMSNEIWNSKGENIYLKGHVVSISFGLLADRENKYKDYLKLIHLYNSGREEKQKIIVRKCILSNKKYEIIYDPQFDYEREI